MVRVVFLGTPTAAQPALGALASDLDVGLVVTQPDRPRGRSKNPVPPPVKVTAAGLALPTSQPENRSELHSAIREAGPFDVGVVVAFGQILRPEVLDLPTHGFLNIHFSLLPRWRGAAPVARALMAGDGMTGVTIMKLDEGLDTGPVLTAQAVDILPDENAGELTERLAHVGSRLLMQCIGPYLTGEMTPVAQSDEGLTYAEKITADDRPLSTSLSPEEFTDRVRGLAPEPGATLHIDGKPFRVVRVDVSDQAVLPGSWESHGGWPVIGLAEGSIRIRTIQAAGKRAMSGEDWLRGSRRKSGTVG